MSADPFEELVAKVVELIRAHPGASGIAESLVRQVAREFVAGGGFAATQPPDAAGLSELIERARFLARVADEERGIRAKLAMKLGSSLDDLESIVHRQFEGATRDIAQRYAQAVRQERARRVTESVIHGLGGDAATLESILGGVANAVANSVLGPNPTRCEGSSPANPRLSSLGAGDAGQIAQAVSAAVQQVSLNIQKIITVALENERAADAEHPKYYDP